MVAKLHTSSKLIAYNFF